MGKLEERIALITGAGSGMGRAAAELFAAEGAEVVVCDLDGAVAQSVADGIAAAGGRAWAHAADVGDVAALDALFAAIEERHGVLHAVWNHAGIPGPNGLEGVAPADWDAAIAVNLRSVWYGPSLAIPLL